jgi:hypothetical protein
VDDRLNVAEAEVYRVEELSSPNVKNPEMPGTSRQILTTYPGLGTGGARDMDRMLECLRRSVEEEGGTTLLASAQVWALRTQNGSPIIPHASDLGPNNRDLDLNPCPRHSLSMVRNHRGRNLIEVPVVGPLVQNLGLEKMQ